MLEHSVYSVISPEGCSAILWKNSDFKERAAEILKLTAPDLENLGIDVVRGSAKSGEGVNEAFGRLARRPPGSEGSRPPCP